MDIQGKIKVIYDTQLVSDRFKKREFVVEYMDNPQYPQFIKFEVVQDSCGMLDSHQVGEEVSVSFNLRGREWINQQGQAMYFNTLQAWRIQPVAQQQPQGNFPPADNMAPPPAEPPSWSDNGGSSDDDDLPF
ncbi:hypothetical protein FUAX_11980 [Fulvitalea axinellae]|uniref:DUF3127 domain-containing protein n=1 Tax=Fulvitalea axinellae TaxID=1182444 RepID=A0AAU9C9F0_9BACT|nr:hypothetical protein FUAX_11980 [Fulvitalea axinellae]